METNELQKKSNEWVEQIDKHLGVEHDEETTFIHLIEEFGELARQYNDKKIRKIEPNKINIEEEIADVLILIMRLGTIYNIDLEKAVINKIAKLKERHKL